MPFLPYTRIEVFLPCNDVVEREAVGLAEEWMREQFGGATASTKYGPVFRGYWRGTDAWVEDQIVLIIADTADGLEAVNEKLKELRTALVEIYQAAGREQDEFWITVTSISRFVS